LIIVSAGRKYKNYAFFEPGAVEGKSFKQWRNMSLEECVRSEDRECNPQRGDLVDHPSV